MSTRITSHILNGAKVATPLKINMEPQIEGLVQMIFLFKWLVVISGMSWDVCPCNSHHQGLLDLGLPDSSLKRSEVC